MLLSGPAAKSITILAGQQISGNLNLQGERLSGLKVPAGWDAAAISFEVSHDPATASSWGTFNTWDGTTKVTPSIPNASLPPGEWMTMIGDIALALAGYAGVRLKSSVNQTADRIIAVSLTS